MINQNKVSKMDNKNKNKENKEVNKNIKDFQDCKENIK
jgi:hypothetical protein